MSDGSEENGSLLSDFGTHNASEAAPLCTMASAMFFGTITFASAALAARTYLTGDMRAFHAAQNPRSTPLEVRSFASVYTLLHHMTVFGFILLYAYICEYHPPFPHAAKSYDRDEFFFMTAILIVASAYTVTKNDRASKTVDQNHINGTNKQTVAASPRSKEKPVAEVNIANDVLNRSQTEEWKGWMQYMFLLYHYYRAEEVYNSVRVMITCYVWMTGFGNFSFFYLKGDYSSVRVMQMLWRLNFLVIFLCLSQGTTYILYYICILHTYYFLMVFATMRIGKHLNYTRWGLRAKMGILAIIIFLVWDVNSGLFRLVHFPFFRETPTLGATSGTMWEWYYRSSLDHWSAFLGMVFALNFPITSLLIRKLEAQSFVRQVLAKAAVGVALVGSCTVWVLGPFRQDKLEYNATNAYFAFIPLLTYIYLRNLTPWMRSHSLYLLHQIGKTTLETYLMQHHIWLTSNAKSLLTLIPGWPKMNMLVVTIIYYLVSRRLCQLTLFLRGMVLPDDRNKCFRNLALLGGSIGAFYALAISLKSLGVLSFTAVAVASVVCGMLLYQTIVDVTWERYRQSASSNSMLPSNASPMEAMMANGVAHSGSTSSVTVTFPPVIGAMVVLILGLAWQGMSKAGASRIQPLPAGCELFVNSGVWIPVDACNEESRGAGYRNYGITSYATCSPHTQTYVWGWNETVPSSHCRFVHRDKKSQLEALKHRTVTFVGDSITRHVYHAALRGMGMASSGAYNTKVQKWSDLTTTIDTTTMEFEWAALATDQIGKLQDIVKRPLQSPSEQDGSVRPDVIVMGGGAWDRLHVYATDENRESHRNTVKELAKEIKSARSAGIAVVWIIPTTINSKALLTEEKQKNIKEEDMEAMRALYASLGVLDAASFVIDGPAFTFSRVGESYDGVHYPLSVYDAGAQILANAMDWILPKRDIPDDFLPPHPGAMANPLLGLMILCFAFMGIVFFDGFVGFSYLASIFIQGIMPADLHDEAFTSLHERHNLPEIDFCSNTSSSGSTSGSGVGSRSTYSVRSGKSAASAGTTKSEASGHNSVDAEIASLLGLTNSKLEMSRLK